MNVPFFTVIVCTYQRAHLIERALNSLLLQKESNWEVLIVDDGSTDNTKSIVQKYIDTDERFRYFQNNHAGVSSSRNYGIQHSRGLFITFLDSDDEYSDDHLSTRFQILSSNTDIHFLHGGVEMIGSNMIRDRFNPNEWVHLDECVIGGTFFIRRDVFNQVGLFSYLDYGDDADFYQRVSDFNLNIVRTDYPSYRYYRDSLNV